MKLAKVIGTAVASAKHPDFEGHKILVVQPVKPDGKQDGKSFLSIDSVQAGVGDLVLVAREGNAARQILGKSDAPFHSVILGIVDDIDI